MVHLPAAVLGETAARSPGKTARTDQAKPAQRTPRWRRREPGARHDGTQRSAIAGAREHLQTTRNPGPRRRLHNPPASSRGYGRFANRGRLAALSNPRGLHLPPLEQTGEPRKIDRARIVALSKHTARKPASPLLNPRAGSTIALSRLVHLSQPPPKLEPQSALDPHAGQNFGRERALTLSQPRLAPPPAALLNPHAGHTHTGDRTATLAVPITRQAVPPGPGSYTLPPAGSLALTSAHLL